MKNNSALYTKTCNQSYHLELQKGKRKVYENITTPLKQKIGEGAKLLVG